MSYRPNKEFKTGIYVYCSDLFEMKNKSNKGSAMKGNFWHAHRKKKYMSQYLLDAALICFAINYNMSLNYYGT